MFDRFEGEEGFPEVSSIHVIDTKRGRARFDV
jgi:hypothetical protein